MKPTIDNIVLAAFKELDVVFHATTLIEKVRSNPQTAKTFEGSILRSLRKLRSKGLINYEMANHNKSIYRKKKNLNSQ